MVDPLNPGNYIGSVEVKQADTLEFAEYTEKDWAMYFIECYGQIDGDHHKAWVLDQVARILQGTPITIMKACWDSGYFEYRVYTGNASDEYYKWAKSMLGEEHDGEYEYDYDEGIAP